MYVYAAGNNFLAKLMCHKQVGSVDFVDKSVIQMQYVSILVFTGSYPQQTRSEYGVHRSQQLVGWCVLVWEEPQF